VSGTAVHGWEFCDETDEQYDFTPVRSDICSWATVTSSSNVLQPAATAAYSIMLQLNYAPIQLCFNPIMLHFNYAPIQLCSISIMLQFNYSPIPPKFLVSQSNNW